MALVSGKGVGHSRLCVASAWALVVGIGCGRIGYLDHTESTGGKAGSPSSGGVASVDASSGGGASGGGGGGVSGTGGDGGAGAAAASGGSGAGRDASVATGGAGSRDAGPADASTCTVVTSTVSDYCATLPFLPSPPVIDGKLDCGVALSTLTPVDWTGGPTSPDASAEYAVAWRPGGLYFFVRVHDPSLVPAPPSLYSWQGDGVELYMDSDGVYGAPPAYDNPGTRQFTVAAPATATSSVARAQVWLPGAAGSDWISSQFRAYGAADGYVVEAFVAGTDLGLPGLVLAQGGTVGMDLSIDVSFPTNRGPDAGGGGNRLGQYFLHVAGADAGGGIPPFDPRAFCRPTLASP